VLTSKIAVYLETVVSCNHVVVQEIMFPHFVQIRLTHKLILKMSLKCCFIVELHVIMSIRLCFEYYFGLIGLEKDFTQRLCLLMAGIWNDRSLKWHKIQGECYCHC
jgi:hypothetical protein